MPAKSKFLKGQLLLDGGKLHGSFFHRSVVLVCQHDAGGAFGLVLNRQLGKSLGEVCSEPMSPAIATQPLFAGGPVQAGALTYLHSDGVLLKANVIPKLAMGHDLDALIEMGTKDIAPEKLRVFAGYSGWTGGQLEDEMEREAWITHPASLKWVFDPNPDELWRTLLRTKGWEYRLLADGPEDPAWN
jgi:putative transcriptional regulator